MTRFIIVGVVLIAVGLFALYRTAPEPEYETAVFSGVSLNVEIVRTQAERSKGLSGRESVPTDYGMLFVFPAAGRYGIWMKDMLAPLDIYWLDDKGQVIAMFTDVATSTYPTVFSPLAPANYVLETAAGFASQNGVATGTVLHLQSWPSVSK